MFSSFPVLHQQPISSPTPKGERRCRCVAASGQLEEPIHGESLPFQRPLSGTWLGNNRARQNGVASRLPEWGVSLDRSKEPGESVCSHPLKVRH